MTEKKKEPEPEADAKALGKILKGAAKKP